MVKPNLTSHLRHYWRHTSIKLTLWIGLKCFLGMCAVGGIATFYHDPLIIGPLAASCAVIFTKQFPVKIQGPKVIFGNLIGAVVGLLLVHYTHADNLFIACAVLLTIVLMELTQFMHLPACAATASIVLTHAPTTCLISFGIGSVTLVLAAGIFNTISARFLKKGL